VNYFSLAGSILTGLIALRAVLMIGATSTGYKKFTYSQGFLINALMAAVFGTLAVWLFGMVAQA
jgi:hypothetical protein